METSIGRMPDVAKSKQAAVQGAINWVGMERLEWPVRLSFEGQTFLTNALVDCFVSLDDPTAKGIHMSRLYQLFWDYHQRGEIFSVAGLVSLTQLMVASQSGLSQNARIQIDFTFPALRQSLKSEITGYRSYPLRFAVELLQNEIAIEVSGQILYSSTCPCSAALARQLNRQHFLETFGSDSKVETYVVAEWMKSEESVQATPHAQRSTLDFKIKVDEKFSTQDVLKIVDDLEKALKTPVQTAVKREDEQEFARLNAAQLMFCEDAARIAKQALESRQDLKNYWLKVAHLESLHPHNAVAIAKGARP